MRRADPAPERAPYLPEGHVDRPEGQVDAAARRPGAPSSAAGEPAGAAGAPGVVALGLVGWLRWTWRQLTSMRVALLLLMLLALAALPGSVLPQRPQAPERVAQYLLDNPGTGPWLDRLGFFDVFASVWFSAIYLLLFVSLVGCILPRAAAHARALRADPPRVPRSFARFPARGERVVDVSPPQAQRLVLLALRGRYRTRAGAAPGQGDGVAPGQGDGAASVVLTVRAERGYLRETGNLVFHLALVGLLVAVALGQLFHYRGQAIVVEGRGFANAVVAYDSFQSGPWFRDAALSPFALTLDEFSAEFDPLTLAPRDFTARVTVREAGGGEHQDQIKVNHPLTVDGARVYLSGNGYAPALTVRDGAGQVAFSGPVPFLPQDAVYTSRGVVKVPDVSGEQPQLGFVGFLLPSAVLEGEGARSVFPQPLAPLLVLTVYSGDLGLDDGIPQNVYELDTTRMAPVEDDDGEGVTILLEPGQTAQLPAGLGSVTFDALPRFAALDLRHDPAIGSVLVFSLLALAGLGASLFVPRRRLWVRIGAGEGGRTVVAAAGLARGDDPGLHADVERVLAALPTGSPEAPGRPAAPPSPT